MKKEEKDMIFEEFSVHMESFIEEQAQILRADIHTYNKQKSLYEDSYTIA